MNPALLRRCDKFLKTCRDHPERPRLFVQGDSWLSLPGGLWEGKSVVAHLNNSAWLKSQGAPLFNVLSVANPGKILARMARDSDMHQVLGYLQLRAAELGVDYRYDAVLITGGGNDILDNPRTLIDSSGTIRQDMVDAAMNGIRDAWISLLQVFGPWGCPILSHGYGPVTPTRKSGSIIIPGKSIGPWVGDYLLGELNLPVANAKALVSSVIDTLNSTLAAINGVAYFDVRAAVDAIPAKDWHDEIHFFEPGWEKLSQAWLAAIQANVPRAASTDGAILKAKVAKSTTPLFKHVAPAIRSAIKSADAKEAVTRRLAASRKPKRRAPR